MKRNWYYLIVISPIAGTIAVMSNPTSWGAFCLGLSATLFAVCAAMGLKRQNQKGGDDDQT